MKQERLKTAPWARRELCRDYAGRRPWCFFSRAPWIRGRVTQPERALTCSLHSWRAGRGGGACNMKPPPDQQTHNTQPWSLCTFSSWPAYQLVSTWNALRSETKTRQWYTLYSDTSTATNTKIKLILTQRKQLQPRPLHWNFERVHFKHIKIIITIINNHQLKYI